MKLDDKTVSRFIGPKTVELLFIIMEPVSTGQLHNRGAVLTFGALQVSIGILLVLLDIAAFVFDLFSVIDTVFASGIWAGIFFILTGAFGIVAGQHIPPHQTPRSRRCYLITTLVLSIFGLLFTVVLCPTAALIGPVGYFHNYEYFSSLAAGFLNVHAVLFGIMFFINLGQLISASVNVHKLSSSVSLATIIMTTTTTAADPRAIAMAVQTHPAAVAAPYNGYPPPYTGQQQTYVQQAVETHPK